MTAESHDGNGDTDAKGRTFGFHAPDNDMLMAEEAFGTNGKRIMRTIPIDDDVYYIDARDAGFLIREERWKWHVVMFWLEVSQAAMLQFTENFLKGEYDDEIASG